MSHIRIVSGQKTEKRNDRIMAFLSLCNDWVKVGDWVWLSDTQSIYDITCVGSDGRVQLTHKHSRPIPNGVSHVMRDKVLQQTSSASVTITHCPPAAAEGSYFNWWGL